MDETKQKIDRLRTEIRYHSEKYHTEDRPEIDDYTYDMLVRELKSLEAEFPEYDDTDSPTHRVGDTPLDKFEKVIHTVPMGSLQDVFPMKN